MALLALFDVDGTLLLGHDELAVDAFLGALRELYPVDPPDDAFAQVSHRGETSLRIARRILRSEGIPRQRSTDGSTTGACSSRSATWRFSQARTRRVGRRHLARRRPSPVLRRQMSGLPS